MGPEELAAIAGSVFGSRWLRPLARMLECNPGLIRSCKKGERVLSGEAAAKVRALADIGPVGEIVRRILERTIRDTRPVITHGVATAIVTELTNAGLLVPAAQRTPVSAGRPNGQITRYSLPNGGCHGNG
jgi:hypothetical protein